MKFCSACGAKNVEDFKFCSECGAKNSTIEKETKEYDSPMKPDQQMKPRTPRTVKEKPNLDEIFEEKVEEKAKEESFEEEDTENWPFPIPLEELKNSGKYELWIVKDKGGLDAIKERKNTELNYPPLSGFSQDRSVYITPTSNQLIANVIVSDDMSLTWGIPFSKEISFFKPTIEAPPSNKDLFKKPLNTLKYPNLHVRYCPPGGTIPEIPIQKFKPGTWSHKKLDDSNEHSFKINGNNSNKQQDKNNKKVKNDKKDKNVKKEIKKKEKRKGHDDEERSKKKSKLV